MAIGDEPKPPQVEQKEKINLRILYAEDYDSIRFVVERTLKARYAHVESVVNGRLLLEKLSAPGATFDIILTDNNMPEVKGLEAIKQIRESKETWKDIPIILYTTDTGDIKIATDAMGAVLLEKPASSSVIFQEIEKLAKPAK